MNKKSSGFLIYPPASTLNLKVAKHDLLISQNHPQGSKNFQVQGAIKSEKEKKYCFLYLFYAF